MYTDLLALGTDIDAAFAAQNITLPLAARRILSAFTVAMTSAGEQFPSPYDPNPQPSYNFVGGQAGTSACPAGQAALYGGPSGAFVGCVALLADNPTGLAQLVAFAHIPAIQAAVTAGDFDALAAAYLRMGLVPTQAALLRAYVPGQGAALYAQAMYLAAQSIAQAANEPVFGQVPVAMRVSASPPPAPPPPPPFNPFNPFGSFNPFGAGASTPPPTLPFNPVDPFGTGFSTRPPTPSLSPFGNGLPGSSSSNFVPGQASSPGGTITTTTSSPPASSSGGSPITNGPAPSKAIPYALAAIAATGLLVYLVTHERAADHRSMRAA